MGREVNNGATIFLEYLFNISIKNKTRKNMLTFIYHNPNNI